MRTNSAALRKGDLVLLDGGSQVLAFLRQEGGERVLVAHNVTDGFATSSALRFEANGFDALFGDITGSPSGSGPGAWTVSLPPRTTMIWKLR